MFGSQSVAILSYLAAILDLARFGGKQDTLNLHLVSEHFLKVHVLKTNRAKYDVGMQR